MPKTLYYIKNVCLYHYAIRLSISYRVIEALSCWKKVLGVILVLSDCCQVIVPLLSLCHYLNAVYQC